ncbi:MAG: DNA gyrase modulator, partial [Gemmatimonadaceae bacterium]
MTDRREFLKQGALAATGVALGVSSLRPRLLGAAEHTGSVDPAAKELMLAALDAATSAGAGYADARLGRYRQNFVFTREQQILNVVDTDSTGIGVRVLVDGTWGFAATRLLTKDGVAMAAREAVAIAKANRIARDRPVELAPSPRVPDATWKSPFTIDPFTIPVEQKADLLLRANAQAMKVPGVKFVSS